MIVGAICMSHSPLLDKVRAPAETEAAFNEALERVRDKVFALKPDLAVVFYPDHLNGFFYDLLPAFCVGIEGYSVGDYGSSAGRLTVPVPLAEELVRSIIHDGVDTALSYKIVVDHGAVQPLELLAIGHDLPPFIPVFINSAAAPRPTFRRVRAMGEAVGRWAARRPERVLLIGSGGLSHDPPIPAFAGAAPELRNMLINGIGNITFEQRFARTSKVVGEGVKVQMGLSNLRPPNPEWDRMLLDAFVSAKLDVLDESDDDELTDICGRGGHEIRTWVATLAALSSQGEYQATVDFYQPVEVWLTGMGVMTAIPAIPSRPCVQP
ncbi:UNVERIFIED_ORG: 2,3-dihydroxyphenylpropionate 1,2-dioxygenase [Xanthobacter viscosus]|uniref:3-carboxyethylcatechol 2,3-dioxygenase n=1 Tax=Xanthobacter autotrophicus TaxID=280 RepID=A0A6C1KB38_XANAU|nr:3-carboxyethylcatechol 2,3-dioxygenase [Xanthobacter autotrophicus]TLX41370.1 3-carboxyethylcatechol 2,3-dioxygenase [Xanthobacter autotrophicus]